MKRKVMALLVVSLLLFSNVWGESSGTVSQELGIKTAVGGTVIMQGAPKANDDKNDKLSSASYLFDLKLTKEFENRKVEVHFKGGNGYGLEVDGSGENGVNTYAQVNANADPSLVGSVEPAKLVEMYYEQTIYIFNKKFTVDFGKLNFWAFFSDNNFANDDSSQFVTGGFCGDKAIDSVPQHPALRLNYDLNENFAISYAYFTTNLDRIDADGINIAQVNVKLSTNGNYRLYFWGNNSTHYKFSDPNSKSGTHGFGISADQAVNNYLGLFARVGYKNHAVEFKNSNNTFALPLSLIWSVGAQIKGYKWLRENDTVGIAVGQIHGSSDAKGVITEYNNGNYKDTAETQLEVYYKLMLNSYIALTPALQYVANPRGGNVLTNAKNANNNVFVYGIRTSFNF